jgi:hypothetical protein
MALHAPKNAVVDPKTGLVTPEWLNWLQGVADATEREIERPVTPPSNGNGSGGGTGGGGGTGSGGGTGGGGSTIVNDYGSGTAGQLTKWVGTQKLGDSIMSEVGNTVKIAGNIEANNLSSGGGALFLGASQIEWVQANPLAWLPASGIQFINRGRKTGTVFVRLRARDGGVSARLQNVTTNTTAGASSVIASATLVMVSFPVTLVEGQTYELQLLPTLVDTDVQGIGYLE